MVKLFVSTREKAVHRVTECVRSYTSIEQRKFYSENRENQNEKNQNKTKKRIEIIVAKCLHFTTENNK